MVAGVLLEDASLDLLYEQDRGEDHRGAEVAADELPTPDILSPPPPRNRESSQRELDAMGVKLMEALRTFRVDGELVGRTTGPVVTQFEIEPAPGVKVRQIANLANDLALAMRAPSIRIVAPIPGRGAVGVGAGLRGAVSRRPLDHARVRDPGS